MVCAPQSAMDRVQYFWRFSVPIPIEITGPKTGNIHASTRAYDAKHVYSYGQSTKTHARVCRCSLAHGYRQTSLFSDRQPNKRGNPIGLLDSFLHDRSVPYRTAMSSPLLAPRACSRMSPHLSYGTISMRSVVQHTRRFIQQHPFQRIIVNRFNHFYHGCIGGDTSCKSLKIKSILNGDVLIREQNRCAHLGNISSDWKRGKKAKLVFLWWMPVCDFLNHTGWISFRMRAMLVSFACYHLWLDWREIHPHLAQMFTDYEPGIHLCQLQMQAGTTGINTIRMYNPIKQGQTLDPNGIFIRKWIPEIQNRSNQQIHLPKWNSFHCFMKREDYPKSIVDIENKGRKAKEVLYALQATVKCTYRADASRRKRNKDTLLHDNKTRNDLRNRIQCFCVILRSAARFSFTRTLRLLMGALPHRTRREETSSREPHPHLFESHKITCRGWNS